MGQKVNPIGYRLSVAKSWNSVWFADRDDGQYRDWLKEDMCIRAFLFKKLRRSSVSKVIIKRTAGSISVSIYTARVAVVVGRGGADIANLSAAVSQLIGSKVDINVVEVTKPETDAAIVATLISQQLEKRVSFKRAMKHFMGLCMRNGGKGIKIRCSGRLGGADIARSEWYMEGRIPLHTLRAKIDYGFAEAFTSYGVVGVKVWVYHGDSVRAH